MTQSTTLIHLSDLHFVNTQSILKGLVENHRILSKRHLGWLNHKLRRQKYFDRSLKERILNQLEITDWDYLIITGDLTTLALSREFEEARDRLDPLIRKGPVLFTTGNHDRYVNTFPIANPLSAYFKDCWPFNRTDLENQDTPFLEIGRTAVILELDMAVPRPFYSSRGKLSQDLAALKLKLKNNYKDRLKIAIGHYPAFLPPGEHEGFFHSLEGKEKLQQFLLESDIRFYLHGHIHKSWAFKPSVNSDLTCVNSAGCCRHADGQWSGFSKITITPDNVSIDRLRF